MDIYTAAYRRKSVRKYKEEPPAAAQLESIAKHLAALSPLFPDIDTRIQILKRSEMAAHFTNSTVSAPCYLVLTSENKPGSDENAGFLGEQAVLFLASLGLGTCWLGTLKPKPESMELPYVITIAFGSADEEAFRDSTQGILRKPLGEICLNEAPDSSTKEAAEMVRLAPSALNSQPWRLEFGPERIRMYSEQPGFLKPVRSTGFRGVILGSIVKNFQGIDCGIALAHIAVCAEHMGRKIEFEEESNLESRNHKLIYMLTAKLKPQ